MTKKMTEKTKVTKPPHSSENKSTFRQLAFTLNTRASMIESAGSQVYSLYSDGASRGNPGDSGAGIIIKDAQGRTVKRVRKYLGVGTNNSAEYKALLLGIKIAKSIGIKKLNVYLDSEIVARQIKGEYRVKEPGLKILHRKVLQIMRHFDKINIMKIPRELNREADLLANEAIDGRS